MHRLYCLHKLGEVCTQLQEKTAIHFATLGATYIGHSSTRRVHNLMKSQLYTYLSSEGHLVLPLYDNNKFDQHRSIKIAIANGNLKTLQHETKTQQHNNKT